MKSSIYLDYHATTPCDPRVVEGMLPYFTDTFANASSTTHEAGRNAAEAVERARTEVARLIGAHRKEIVFTGGATESNNLAIAGVARASNGGGRKRIVTTAVEHKSVLLLCNELGKQHFDIVILPVDRTGRVDIRAAESAINDDTLLVSIQAASNEVGTIQRVREIAEIAHSHEALVHCDAAQAVGKIGVDVREWDVDMLSISAHKLYGPKGVGALYLKGGPHALPVAPILVGGGQEWGLRSGTLNVPGIVGMGTACRICTEEFEADAARVGELRDYLERGLTEEIPTAIINGDRHARLPNNISVTLPGIDAEALISNLPNIAVSTGSACMAGAPEPSYVLLALGLSRQDAYSTLRIGLGRFTTEAEVHAALASILSAYKRLSLLAVPAGS